MQKKGLILFERSRSVCSEFEKAGLEMYSMDILPALKQSPNHIIGDCFNLNIEFLKQFDFIGAHPPCTYLTFANCGGKRNYCNRSGYRGIETDIAIFRFNQIFDLIKKLDKPGYIENPPFNPYCQKLLPISNTLLRSDSFNYESKKYFQLFLNHLPPLISSGYHPGPYNKGIEKYSSKDKISRNFFPEEISKAMVNQWLKYI